MYSSKEGVLAQFQRSKKKRKKKKDVPNLHSGKGKRGTRVGEEKRRAGCLRSEIFLERTGRYRRGGKSFAAGGERGGGESAQEGVGGRRKEACYRCKGLTTFDLFGTKKGKFASCWSRKCW